MLFYPCANFVLFVLFCFNDSATTEIYTLSLHDALPISRRVSRQLPVPPREFNVLHRNRPPGESAMRTPAPLPGHPLDRKSTRLNSSHANISYAVFCLKKKKKKKNNNTKLIKKKTTKVYE